MSLYGVSFECFSAIIAGGIALSSLPHIGLVLQLQACNRKKKPNIVFIMADDMGLGGSHQEMLEKLVNALTEQETSR